LPGALAENADGSKRLVAYGDGCVAGGVGGVGGGVIFWRIGRWVGRAAD